MPTAGPDGSLPRPVVRGCDFPLWDEVPEGWLREHGRTRVLVIDDQWTGRGHFFGVASPDAPLKPEESLLRRWLNTEVVFFPRPADYGYVAGDEVPRGTFDEAWFREGLASVLADPQPVAAVLLDLLYGTEKDIEDASGPRFLRLLREHLPDVPVLILSNVEGSLRVRGIVKEGGGSGTGDVSFQEYLPKRVQDGPPLLERLREKLLAWADLSDPTLSAFSPAMRRLARQMRRILLNPERVPYEEKNADYPRPVLITGPVGSGKNYVANRLQAMSDRRGNPYRVVDFAGHEEKNFTIQLFGSGTHSNPAYFYRVRRSDAAVLHRAATRARLGAGQNDEILTQLGVFHEAHIADQPPSANQAPLLGTVLIDEIGAAPQDMQTRLLGVFNRGRFNPHMTSANLPEQGALDVWFLVTLSPEGQGKLREDLRTRLDRAHRLTVPPLDVRAEDVLPLTMGLLTESVTTTPDRLLTKGALNALPEIFATKQVRELVNTITRLPDFSASKPYSDDDLRQAIEAALRLDDGEAALDEPLPPHPPQPAADPLAVLEVWSKAGAVACTADLRDRAGLRGKGRAVLGGASAVVLSFLELCAEANCGPDGYSSARTWNFFAGTKGVKPPEARTRIASLFLMDEEATVHALRRSDALLWLAWDASATRRKELRKVVERLGAERDQGQRFERLRIPHIGQPANGST